MTVTRTPSCMPVTVAERHHYDLQPEQCWRISYLRRRPAGWAAVVSFVDRVRAKRFCTKHALEFPPAAYGYQVTPQAAVVDAANQPEPVLSTDRPDFRARRAGDL